jgi:RNA polymerase sigma-70 factor (sigma-E family)
MVMTFEQFACTRVGALLRMANAICRDASLAEDLVQDVLIKVQLRWEQISGLDIPDAYIRRMLVNEYLTLRRKAARTIPRAVIEPSEQEPDHAQAYAERDALQREIAQLPPQQQIVLALRYHGGLSDAEIASAMGCRVGTVRGYASRALRSLRVQLTGSTPTQMEGRAR